MPRDFEREIREWNLASPEGTAVRIGRRSRTWYTTGPARMSERIGRPVVPLAGVGDVRLDVVRPAEQAAAALDTMEDD